MILQNNTRLQNRYLIVRLLGQGGFGAVYEARHLGLGHRVALKQLILADPRAMKAFEREARILARLKHPALPRVSDYFADSNSYFLVMEYIEGDDFEVLLKRRTSPFSVEQVLEWADQLLEVLDYVHRQQPPVIHRDIKPANIKLSPAGKIYLLDFGISKGGRTHTNQAMSGRSIHAFSQNYASIEQIEGKGTDARSDLYSLAVTLHHMLTKQEPPQTVSRLSAKAMNRPDPLPPVNQLNRQVPVGVAQVLIRALSFDPNLRPQSAAAMRQLLKEAIPAPQLPPTLLKETIPAPQLPPTLLIHQPQPLQPSNPPTSFSWPLGVGVGLILLLLGLMGGWVLFAPDSDITEIDNMGQVYVPEGKFLMGSTPGESDADDEEPQRTVYLDAFWIDQTEVTNAMSEECASAGHCRPPQVDGSWTQESYYGNDTYANYPVVGVSWEDANAYCAWTGRRLPTEAEWEKAARGTDGRKYAWGNEAPADNRANLCDQNCSFDWKDKAIDDGYAYTAPVGTYADGASPYDVLDMSGNVSEWVNDWYDPAHYISGATRNPTGPNDGSFRLLRGGSWNNVPNHIRTTVRIPTAPSVRLNDFGFRCAQTVK